MLSHLDVEAHDVVSVEESQLCGDGSCQWLIFPTEKEGIVLCMVEIDAVKDGVWGRRRSGEFPLPLTVWDVAGIICIENLKSSLYWADNCHCTISNFEWENRAGVFRPALGGRCSHVHRTCHTGYVAYGRSSPTTHTP